MKIAVTGKGGGGKTTVAATLARLYAQDGRKVLAADADPDANLGLALGFAPEELADIVPISKMKKLAKERTGADQSNVFYKINPKVDDIPDKFGRVCNGVKLLVLGTIETAWGGCICPEGVMLQRIIGNLVLFRDDVVILDMEAGIEHFGRGIDDSADVILMVIDPFFESLRLSRKVRDLSASIGKPILYVLNKVNRGDESFMLEMVGRPAAIFYAGTEIAMAGLKGEELSGGYPAIQQLVADLLAAGGA